MQPFPVLCVTVPSARTLTFSKKLWNSTPISSVHFRRNNSRCRASVFPMNSHPSVSLFKPEGIRLANADHGLFQAMPRNFHATRLREPLRSDSADLEGK